MLHQGHRGWGRFPSSTMITVSRTCRCRKYTQRPVLVISLPLYPLTGKSRGSAVLRKKQICLRFSCGRYIPLIYQANAILCLEVGYKRPHCKVRSTVWELCWNLIPDSLDQVESQMDSNAIYYFEFQTWNLDLQPTQNRSKLTIQLL